MVSIQHELYLFSLYKCVYFRLFFVCKPNIPPMDKLEDAFKMFEGLIDMYVIDGMNYGFVTYDSVASATRAINVI